MKLAHRPEATNSLATTPSETDRRTVTELFRELPLEVLKHTAKAGWSLQTREMAIQEIERRIRG